MPTPERPLTLATTRTAGAAVVTAAGELDAATVQEFVWAVDAALAERPNVLCLDLVAVTFADSSALAALVRTRRLTAWRGTALTIVPGEGGMRRLLDITSFDRVLDVYSTVDEALALDGARRAARVPAPPPPDATGGGLLGLAG